MDPAELAEAAEASAVGPGGGQSAETARLDKQLARP
jgi:hypothetical protein